MTTMPKGINWNEQFYKLLRLSLRLTQEFIVNVNAETYPQKTMLFSSIGQLSATYATR